VLVQAVFAGQFLSGSDNQVALHEEMGWIIFSISAVQVILAVAFLRSGIVSLWLMFGSVFLFLGEGLQLGTGYARFLGVHVPLGVMIFGLVSWQLLEVSLRPTAGKRE
jgi:hypothetical protein